MIIIKFNNNNNKTYIRKNIANKNPFKQMIN